MKKTGILNADLMYVITTMGHTDRIAIADSGLPIPASVRRIDLALSVGIPTFLQTLAAVLGDLQVEAAVVAEEMARRSPALYAAVNRMLGGIRVEQVPHETFKSLLIGTRAVVRTGEQTPYANVILQSGVTF